MKVGFAARFYADAGTSAGIRATLARALANCRPRRNAYEVGRMKRAYPTHARTRVRDSQPRRTILVVENAEEFDEAGAHAHLSKHAHYASVPSAVVTYGADAAVDRDWYDEIVPAKDAVLAAMPWSPRSELRPTALPAPPTVSARVIREVSRKEYRRAASR